MFDSQERMLIQKIKLIVATPILFAIKVYQILFSFDHGIPHILFPNIRVCRHFPSCSEYTYKVVEKFGPLKGLILGMKRVLSCTPFTEANKYDPVPG